MMLTRNNKNRKAAREYFGITGQQSTTKGKPKSHKKLQYCGGYHWRHAND